MELKQNPRKAVEILKNRNWKEKEKAEALTLLKTTNPRQAAEVEWHTENTEKQTTTKRCSLPIILCEISATIPKEEIEEESQIAIREKVEKNKTSGTDEEPEADPGGSKDANKKGKKINPKRYSP